MNRPHLGFVGAGVVGSTLAVGLSRAGYPVVAVSSRSSERRATLADRLPSATVVETPEAVVRDAALVFLTVPDDVIEPLAASMAWSSGHSVVHCSGAASLDPLEPARVQGAEVGVFHPLQTFARADRAEMILPGSAFGIEASSDDLHAVLAEMAQALGGTPLTVSGDKAIYHASAVIASNYLVTLLDAASGLWESLGIPQGEGLKALLPLVRGTIENLETIGLPDALTGPIARGDIGTVERHLHALARVAPNLIPMYKELARRAVPIALAKGTLDDASATRLLDRLEAR